MSDDLIWRIGARLPGHDYKIFRTALLEGTHPRTGEPKQFSVIECADWVNVIALTSDECVVLVRQYRPGTNTVSLEIPGGVVDDGEDPATAAARELEEETGYTSRNWRKLGTVAPNPAIMNNTLHTYLALDAQPTAALRPDDGEVLAVETMSLAGVQTMMRAGRIEHALVVAAFGMLAFELGALRRP